MRPTVRIQQQDLVLIKRVVDTLATCDVLYADHDAAAEDMGRRARQAIANIWYVLNSSEEETRQRARTALRELRTELEARIRDYGKETVRLAGD